MKISKSNGKRIGHHKTAHDGEFAGCALSLDHATLPVGLEFKDLNNWRESTLVCMTIEDAERVHKALGVMIELRKRQAVQDAAMKKVGALQRRADEIGAAIAAKPYEER